MYDQQCVSCVVSVERHNSCSAECNTTATTSHQSTLVDTGTQRHLLDLNSYGEPTEFSGTDLRHIEVLTQLGMFPTGSDRFVLPLTTEKTYYVSFSVNPPSQPSRSNPTVEILLLCFSFYDQQNPVFRIPLPYAYLVTGTCSSRGPCLYLSTTIGVFEFQCFSHPEELTETSLQFLEHPSENATESQCHDYSFWVSLFDFLGVRRICVSDLFFLYKHQCIGEGSFSRVMHTKHRYTFTPLVLKAVRKARLQRLPSGCQSAGEVEIDILSKLDHPYIVRLQTAFQDDYCYYIVLEYLQGCNVYEWISRHGVYTELQARMTMFRVFSALMELQVNHVLHRDLKLENLVLEHPNDPTSIKVIDFGLGAFLNTPRMEMKCGTPGFVAPEIILRKEYDTAVDIFSAGVILYCILTERAPFYTFGDTPSMVLYRNKNCQMSCDAAVVWNQLSIDVRDLLMKLLNRNPEQRCSASQALMHPWITGSLTRLSLNVPYNNFFPQSHHRDLEFNLRRVNQTMRDIEALLVLSFASRNKTNTNYDNKLCRRHPYRRAHLHIETSVTRLFLLNPFQFFKPLDPFPSSNTDVERHNSPVLERSSFSLADPFFTHLMLPSLGTRYYLSTSSFISSFRLSLGILSVSSMMSLASKL